MAVLFDTIDCYIPSYPTATLVSLVLFYPLSSSAVSLTHSLTHSRQSGIRPFSNTCPLKYVGTSISASSHPGPDSRPCSTTLTFWPDSPRPLSQLSWSPPWSLHYALSPLSWLVRSRHCRYYHLPRQPFSIVSTIPNVSPMFPD